MVSFNVAMLEAMKAEGLDLDACIRVLKAGEVRRDTTATERKRRQRARDRDMSQRDVTRDNGSPIEELLSPSEALPDEASASSPVRQPLAAGLAVWNENAVEVGWPTVQASTPARDKALGARLRQHGIDGWRAGIARARASPYLAGADPPSWFTFDWLVKAGNFQKLIEGNYDRNRSHNQPSGWQGAVAALGG